MTACSVQVDHGNGCAGCSSVTACSVKAMLTMGMVMLGNCNSVQFDDHLFWLGYAGQLQFGDRLFCAGDADHGNG